MEVAMISVSAAGVLEARAEVPEGYFSPGDPMPPDEDDLLYNLLADHEVRLLLIENGFQSV